MCLWVMCLCRPLSVCTILRLLSRVKNTKNHNILDAFVTTDNACPPFYLTPGDLECSPGSSTQASKGSRAEKMFSSVLERPQRW